MGKQVKYDRILDALQELLENQKMQSISVSEIAQTAGIGKGSIYYYFPSKDAILEALVERNYEKPLRTAKALAYQTDISPFTRMAMIFQACRNSSSEFVKSEDSAGSGVQEKALLHQKYVRRRRSFTRNMSITSSLSSSRYWRRLSGRELPREIFISKIPPPWQRSC